MATKKKTATKKPAKKQGQDIPLDNIPDRKHKSYSAEFKQQTVDRVKAGESAEQVAQDMGISTVSLIHRWVQMVNEGKPLRQHGGAWNRSGKPGKAESPTAALRASLEHAVKARDERLEAAASICEFDLGDKGMAAAIRKRKSAP